MTPLTRVKVDSRAGPTMPLSALYEEYSWKLETVMLSSVARTILSPEFASPCVALIAFKRNELNFVFFSLSFRMFVRLRTMKLYCCIWK